jgi:hypothetical protein
LRGDAVFLSESHSLSQLPCSGSLRGLAAASTRNFIVAVGAARAAGGFCAASSGVRPREIGCLSAAPVLRGGAVFLSLAEPAALLRLSTGSCRGLYAALYRRCGCYPCCGRLLRSQFRCAGPGNRLSVGRPGVARRGCLPLAR